MTIRTIAALIGAIFMVCATTTAQARVEGSDSAAKQYSQKSVLKSGSTKNYKSTKSRGYASKKKYGKSYASKSYSKKSGRRLASRAFTSGRGDGGSSRSCLTSSARSLLSRIESRFGSVNIISTCRPGARIATTGKPSKHGSGQAIDFSAPGRKAAVVQWLIANHKSGGTMTYRDMDHIHVDVGYHFVSLGSYSGRS
jgi:uncharacterized protein YcbK (DUF882 family)